MVATNKKLAPISIQTLLNGERVRRVEQDGRTLYGVLDLVALVCDTASPEHVWTDIKRRDPRVRKLAERVNEAGVRSDLASPAQPWEAVDRSGLLRLIQSLPGPRAERLKAWLARTAVERMDEAENPELAILRTRRLYEGKGFERRWVDKRLRGVSARHELTGEWYKRGVRESDQFRALTNDIVEGAFGMDVEAFRRHKRLGDPRQNLRDHMTDTELALTALGETTAVALHRARNSEGFEQLHADAQDAGSVVAKTREAIEAKLGRPSE